MYKLWLHIYAIARTLLLHSEHSMDLAGSKISVGKDIATPSILYLEPWGMLQRNKKSQEKFLILHWYSLPLVSPLLLPLVEHSTGFWGQDEPRLKLRYVAPAAERLSGCRLLLYSSSLPLWLRPTFHCTEMLSGSCFFHSAPHRWTWGEATSQEVAARCWDVRPSLPASLHRRSTRNRGKHVVRWPKSSVSTC